MIKYSYAIIIICLALSCNSKDNQEEQVVKKVEIANIPELNLTEAGRLMKLPLHCMDIEYPNKLGQTLGSNEDLKAPKVLHPAFYGCFDWHSAVHGHWSLVSLLKKYPSIENADIIKEKLLLNITKENILEEVRYFEGEHNKSYERTYGWAWLLKLAEELHAWDDPIAGQLQDNLMPLTNLIVEKYIEFLPKLNYPIRVGEHPNTAFGLSFAYDFALALNHEELKALIEKRARDFYMPDQNCPISWEPSGFDFLSPCLEEAAIMKRVLTMDQFRSWIDAFLPQLKDPYFELAPGIVSDRTDGKLVHLDGVNFSRAWSLNKIAEDMP
ncbi:MAG: DUF2891 domain-containing protein, partial [Aureibaculum sp.]